MIIRVLKKSLAAISLVSLCIPCLAFDSPELSIFPASGVMADSSSFDFTLIVKQTYVPIRRIGFEVNGSIALNPFGDCGSEGYTDQNFMIYRCKSVKVAMLGRDMANIMVRVELESGQIISGDVHYQILASQNYTGTSVLLSGASSEVHTNLIVKPGERYLISASGTVSLWPSNPKFPIATANGNGTSCNYSDCLLPGAPTGALLVHVGNSGWMLVGSDFQFTPLTGGELILGINDHVFNDNLGAYQVSVKRVMPIGY